MKLSGANVEPVALTMKTRVVTFLSIVLGLVFLVAGAAKIPMFDQFAGTVASITHVSFGPARIIALIVLAIEVLGGIALFFRFKVTIVSMLFCALVGIFLWVLSSAIVQGREIDCSCFGILNISLSNRAELILDIAFFNLFALLALLSSTKQSGSSTNQKVWWAVAALAVIYLQYSLIAFLSKNNYQGHTLNISPAVLYAEAHNQEFASQKHRNRLLFLVSFVDLNCPPCYEDFITLCDIMQARMPREESNRVLVLFKADDIANPDNPTRLYRWAHASELSFPILIAPDSLFDDIQFTKSSAAVIDSSGKALLHEILPMGNEHQQTVLQLLKESL